MPPMMHKSAIVQENGDVKVITRECMVCGKEGEVLVPKFDWDMYNKNSEMHIQDTLRRVSPGDREQIITGTHDKCFDSLFPPDEEESPYCHCGKKVMAKDIDVAPEQEEHYGSTLFQGYCNECADCRCDTTNGMMDGCPNA